MHDHIYLTRRHHAKSFYTFILAISFNRMGCPTCGGLVIEAFSCHQAARVRSHPPPWTTYGTGRVAFSLFQGVVTNDMNDSYIDE